MKEKTTTKNSENKLAVFALIATIAAFLLHSPLLVLGSVVLIIAAYRKAKSLNGVGMGKVEISLALIIIWIIIFSYGFFVALNR